MNYKLGPGLPEGYRSGDATQILVAYMEAMRVLGEQAKVMLKYATTEDNIRAFTELQQYADDSWSDALSGKISWQNLRFPFGESTQPVKEEE